MKFLRRKNKSALINKRDSSSKNYPTTFSYYARGTSPSSANIGRKGEINVGKNKSFRLKLSHFPSYVALIVIIVALGYSCVLQPNPKIIIVNVPDSVHRDSKAYKDSVNMIWKKSLFSRTKITISTVEVRKEISKSFPEIGDIKIELPLLGRRAKVVLTPVKPAIQLVSVNGSFYVDSNGKVLGKTSELIKNDIRNLPFIRDESGISSDPGKIIIPGPDAKFLQNLFDQLQAQNVAVESITLPVGAAIQANLKVVGQPYYVKFILDSDPRQAVGTYLAAKAKLDSKGILPLEYLDVRVEEKVFYK